MLPACNKGRAMSGERAGLILVRVERLRQSVLNTRRQ
jgi:hypothetical protein